MKRGVLIIVAVAFLILFGLVVFFVSRGSSEKAPATTVLKVWGPFDEKEVYEEIGKSFFTETGFSVEFTYVKADNAKDYEAAVVDAIASGTGPDVWLIRNDWLGKHEAKIVPMPSTLTWSEDKDVSEEEALKGIFGQAVIAQNSVGGAMYAIPLSVDSLALYVNTRVVREVQDALDETGDRRAEIFDSVPVTWGDVDLWNQIITRRSGSGFARSGFAAGTVSNTYAPADLYLAVLQQKGGKLYSPDSRQVALHLATDNGAIPAQQALEALKPFSDPGTPYYSWNAQAGDPVKRFVEGKLAMMIGFSTLRLELFNTDRNFTDYYVTALPQPQDIRIPSDKRVDYAAYWTHVVTKTSPNPDIDWRFLKHLTTLNSQQYYTNQTLKPVLGMLGEVESPDNDFVADPRVFTSQVVTAPAIYKPEWLFVDDALLSMLNSVFSGAQTPQIAVDTTAELLKAGR
jgi:ABC-type glycerol-3-phosphate transport system substrate-binding protein